MRASVSNGTSEQHEVITILENFELRLNVIIEIIFFKRREKTDTSFDDLTILQTTAAWKNMLKLIFYIEFYLISTII